MNTDTKDFRSGFVALVGRPNVGKSTLLNACLGRHLAIESPVAQTTRKRLRGVVTTENSQLIIVDTPGLHKPKDALGKELNKAALMEIRDVDVVAMLIDASMPVGTGDAWVAKHVAESKAFHLLVITKADKVDAEVMQKQIDAAKELCDFDDMIIVSATEGFNVEGFIHVVSEHLPEGPQWFPADMTTDVTDEELVAEFIRERILMNTKEEVPHSVGVICNEIRWKKDHASIEATILVEREGQKGIIIGKGGSMIKKIGTSARQNLEKLFDASVYLDLKVKVAPLWRRDQNEIRRMGYDAKE